MIGQSDTISIETQGRPTWVALEYRPPFALKPDASYAVELLVENEKIDRYMFRVGIGDPVKAIAAAAFATGFNAAGKPTGVRTDFPADAGELVFRARVSNMVDPAGWTFTTLWFRDDVLVAQVNPDESDNPRLLSFTLRPNGELPPGPYSVSLLLNGVEARSAPFTVTVPGAVATETPTATPTAAAGATASVTRLVLTDRVDSSTSAPTGEEVTVWEAPERTSAELWLAIEVQQLTRADVLEVRVNRAGRLYANDRLPRRVVDDGWVAVPLSLDIPANRDGVVEYTISVLLNGNRTESLTVLVVPTRR